ncbi:MAG TPA: hypothetical protein VFZ47_12715, partial [Chitinophagaceae bacterium]
GNSAIKEYRKLEGRFLRSVDGQSYSQTVDLYVEKSQKPGAKISQDFNISLRAKKKFFPRLAWISNDCMSLLLTPIYSCHEPVSECCNRYPSRKATPFHQYFPALLPKEIKVIQKLSHLHIDSMAYARQKLFNVDRKMFCDMVQLPNDLMTC